MPGASLSLTSKLGRAAAFAAAVLAGLAAGAHAADSAAPPEKLSIEALLKDNWEIAGYTGAVDNWSTFILLRRAGEPSLVQCRAGYDVTREPRVQTNCYRLR